MKTKYKFVFDAAIGVYDFDLENAFLEASGVRDVADIELIRILKDTPEEFVEAAAAENADAVCAYSKIDAAGFPKLKNCKIIADPAIGFDCFDLAAATKEGIPVCNSPTFCVDEVATHTVTLALAAMREIATFDRNTRAGNWDWTQRGIQHRLKGQTYGLISFGRIPQRVVELLRGFEMDFIAWDPYLPDSVFEANHVRRAATVEEVFSQALITSVHTPALPSTYHMISDKQFDAIPNSMILVATSRGGVVDEGALVRALESGKICRAGIDVIEDEAKFQTVLQGQRNVTMTPHIAFYSEEANNQLRTEKMQQMIDAVVYKKEPSNILNKDVIENARFHR